MLPFGLASSVDCFTRCSTWSVEWALSNVNAGGASAGKEESEEQGALVAPALVKGGVYVDDTYGAALPTSGGLERWPGLSGMVFPELLKGEAWDQCCPVVQALVLKLLQLGWWISTPKLATGLVVKLLGVMVDLPGSVLFSPPEKVERTASLLSEVEALAGCGKPVPARVLCSLYGKLVSQEVAFRGLQAVLYPVDALGLPNRPGPEELVEELPPEP